MEERRERGILFVISAPSGTGKTTLVRRLLAEEDGVEFSVSYTTRPRREGEQQGREYHFIDPTRFDEMVGRGEFLEWAPVYGERYGTGREATERVLAEGRDLLLDIDVQGARQIRRSGAQAVFVFLLPPDYTTLDQRLRSRRTEDPVGMALRLSLARREAAEYAHYDYLVINHEPEQACLELRSIVRAERRRVSRRSAEAQRILDTFPGSGSG